MMNIKNIAKFVLAILAFFILCGLLTLWSINSKQEGPSKVMVNDTIYTIGMGKGTHILPEGFTFAGEVRHVKKNADDLTNNFDGYNCKRGDRLFINMDNGNVVYLFDRKENKYIPHTSDILQQSLILVESTLYARPRGSGTVFIDRIPSNAKSVGKINSILTDTLPTTNLQMNTEFNFSGYAVYLSDDKAVVYLISKQENQLLMSSFFKLNN